MKTFILIFALVAMLVMLTACAAFEAPYDPSPTFKDLNEPGFIQSVCDAGAMTASCDKSAKRI